MAAASPVKWSPLALARKWTWFLSFVCLSLSLSLHLPLLTPYRLSMCIDFQRLPLGCLKCFLSVAQFLLLPLLLAPLPLLKWFLVPALHCFYATIFGSSPCANEKVQKSMFFWLFIGVFPLTFPLLPPLYSFAFSVFLQVFPSPFFYCILRAERFPVIDDFATRLADIFEVG